MILRKFASSLRVLRVLLWSGGCVRCCGRARLNRLAVDPHSSEFAATDRGGPWDDPKFHRTPFFARVEFPKLAWTGRFAVHGEGNENTKDA